MRKSGGVRAHPSVWLFRLAWLSLPFTLAELLDASVDGRSTPVRIAVAALAWAAWGIGLVAASVPHPVALTTIRIVAPAAVLAGVVAATAGDVEPLGAVGLGAAIVAAAAGLAAPLADAYVDAASYGDERRFALRTPAAFVAGPVVVAWIAVAVVPVAGVLLLAAGRWLAGAAVVAVGIAAAVPAARALHALARRWLVFVPAGMTIVDPYALVEPVLLARRGVVSFEPALEGTGATDLTRGAPGLVLEASLEPGVEMVVRTSRDGGDVVVTRSVLLCPLRPGAVLDEASRRSLGRAQPPPTAQPPTTPPPTTTSPS